MSHQIRPARWQLTLELASTQHGVVSRLQLLACGVTANQIKYWLASKRLHQIHAGIYAVGRREISTFGAWTAAVLACGDTAALSHLSAGALWGLCAPGREIEVTVSRQSPVVRPGIRVYRRAALPRSDLAERDGIPLTNPVRTLIDLALRFADEPLEKAINEADRHGLIDLDRLREELEARPPSPGAPHLRKLLDRRTFRLTDSALERRFLPLARRAGLPIPLTRQFVNGYRVDFYWPDLGLVVESDGLRYHRTAARQSRDARRDQVHAAAGLTALRFTHEQIRYRPAEVEATLCAVAARLGAFDGAGADMPPNTSNAQGH